MATGTAELIDATTADAFFPEIWSRHLTVARENALIFAKLVDRRFEAEVSFGDRIHTTAITNLAARSKDRSANTALSYETVTESNTTVTISTWEYAAFGIETATRKQAMADVVAAYTPKMAYALALAIDDVLAGYPDDFTNAVGTLTQENTYVQLLRARQYLDDANAPQEGRAMAVAPAAEVGVLQLQHFINNDYAKLHGETAKNAHDRAYVTSFMGIPIYKSVNVEGSNAAGHDNAMFQREAVALVVQMKTQSHHFFDIDQLADKYVVEHLHGSGIIRNDHGVFIRGA